MNALAESRRDFATLIVTCPDQPGLVSLITALIARNGGNIVSLDQYTTDPEGGDFFQRVVFHREGLSAARPAIEEDLAATLGPHGISWRLVEGSELKRMAILASKSDHCLLDLLWRHQRGELPVTIPLVISNHTDLAEDVRRFGIPYFHVPSQGPDKSAAEARIRELLDGNVDLVVLARYMQILSEDFIEDVGVPIINIHHSFLPAFIGAGPYRKAKERGVKLIGATAHYVTKDLDEGPIIEQDVTRVTHTMTAADMQAKGAYVEREVLSRAVRLHTEDRVIRHGNQTIVFT
ncbi:formyltetrahydrofolate deformylase [Brevibacterium casei]|uniref:Formyltetrahydrofolate deformylase n=2 Tax=Brevibacterium casei TaxID=33889 RepID=A0A2H1HSX2_9MICO|nr:formyltetrahydrofolate deformylase [Brevibacterium casei]PAK95055.1 formyltetrahydrofolate deformylase [Brevibacterium casei]QPR38408.1 formyltetrahydrofolate deformylase [Brevibacterium casei]QPR42574.1 formyltetrahydrofolate deformylase [Brevibacterium casei]SMX65946.1 formyltetrahydrofolate deformylase [Brevibacterium casei CIP 102111]